MNELHAGILCTVMTLSLCAALHSCLCAFYYKMPRARVLCPMLLIVCFLPLSLLLSRLPETSALNGRLMDGGHSAAFLPERRGADAAAALD